MTLMLSSGFSRVLLLGLRPPQEELRAVMSGLRRSSKLALRLLESLGVSRGRITLEDHSRNTVENAVYSKAIVQPKPDERWLLVTSAYHMARAIGVFRKAGFPVEPYPVDWRASGLDDALHPFATMSEGLRRTDTAVHEWLGLAVYWLTGLSSEDR